PERRGAAFVLDLLRAHATDVRERAVDRPDDVREADLVGRAREPVAALRPAPARDDARVAEVGEDVLEEVRRDRLRLCDALALRRAVACGGELDACSDRVVGLRGDSHRLILARTGR